MPTPVDCRYNPDCNTQAGETCDSEWRLIQSWQLVAPDRAHVVVDSDFGSLVVGDFVEIAPHFHSITIEENINYKKRMIPPAEYLALKDGVTSLQKLYDEFVVLERT